jgi:hypothetical protein
MSGRLTLTVKETCARRGVATAVATRRQFHNQCPQVMYVNSIVKDMSANLWTLVILKQHGPPTGRGPVRC